MKWIKIKGIVKAQKNKLALLGMTLAGVGGAQAYTLAENLANISTVITSLTTWVTDIMDIFMDPPLVIFVGITIGMIAIRQVKRLMHK